ncbi:MAG: GntR family transcriptional regulator [Chloroflexota bacterium]
MNAEVSEFVAPPAGQERDAGYRLKHILERTRVHYRTVGDLAYSVIREGILTGAFPPGSRLRQDELAEAIGVSRMPIRSALLQLEVESLIDFHPNRGAVVKDLKPAQVREVYELRMVLESYALRKAVESITPERLKRLERLSSALDTAREGNTFLDARRAFYHELYDGDRHPLLLDFIEQVRNRLGHYMLTRRVVGHLHEHAHAHLIECVRQGDADAAVAWLHKHLEDVCKEVIARLPA